MPESVKMNLSFFEVEVEFAEPNIRVWLDRAAVVEAIYASLRQWEITVDDIEVIQTGKPSEQGVKFKIPLKRASFFLGAGSCRFTRDNTSWQTAEETIQILNAALSAFTETSKTNLKTFKTSVGLHVQPKIKTFIEILAPLIPQRLTALDVQPAKSMASVVKWPHHRVTLDGSAQIANGVFIKYERDFPAKTGFDAMAKQLYSDQAEIFLMLDIMEE